MNSLLKALYELLSFVTEDAIAHKLGPIPPGLLRKLNEACIELGEYLDTLD